MLVALALWAGACLGRSLPLPPPAQIVQTITECPRSQCPDGGVILRLNGTALAGAFVVAEDTSVPMDPMGGQLLVGSATADRSTGAWGITLTPRTDSTGAVRAVQRGHVIRVFQVNDAGEASLAVYVTVMMR